MATHLQKILLGIAVFFALGVALEACKYLKEKDAVDLCNRITGARLLEKNIPPYTYFWNEDDPQELYNPYETIKGKANSITASPSVLITTLPLSGFYFEEAKWLWLIVSYLLIIGSIYFLSLTAVKEQRMFVWIISIFFFLCSSAWLLHVERGQIYVLYLFLLCTAFYFYTKKRMGWSVAFVIFLSWLRFPFLIFLLPYIGYVKSKKLWTGIASAFLVTAGVSYVFSEYESWLAYREALNYWSTAQIDQAALFADAHSEYWRTFTVGKEQGRDYLINNSSLQYLAQYHLKRPLFPWMLWCLFAAGVVVLLYSLKKYFRQPQKERLFLVCFLIYIWFEVCIPAPRYNYTYIQWLFPFVLAFIYFYKKNSAFIFPVILFITGLLLNMGLFFFLPRIMTFGELILYVVLWWYLWYTARMQGEVNP